MDGVRLTYIERGEGDPVIFVHGGFIDYRSWYFQIRPFSERYRVIAYNRGLREQLSLVIQSAASAVRHFAHLVKRRFKKSKFHDPRRTAVGSNPYGFTRSLIEVEIDVKRANGAHPGLFPRRARWGPSRAHVCILGSEPCHRREVGYVPYMLGRDCESSTSW